MKTELLDRLPRQVWLTPNRIRILLRLPWPPPYTELRKLANSGKLIRDTKKTEEGRKRVRYVRP